MKIVITIKTLTAINVMVQELDMSLRITLLRGDGFLNNFWLPGPQPSPPDTIHEYNKCIN